MKKRCILVVLLFLFALSFTIAEEGYNSYVYSVAQPGEFVFDVSNMDVSNIQSSLKTLDSSLEPRLEGNKLQDRKSVV